MTIVRFIKSGTEVITDLSLSLSLITIRPTVLKLLMMRETVIWEALRVLSLLPVWEALRALSLLPVWEAVRALATAQVGGKLSCGLLQSLASHINMR